MVFVALVDLINQRFNLILSGTDGNRTGTILRLRREIFFIDDDDPVAAFSQIQQAAVFVVLRAAGVQHDQDQFRFLQRLHGTLDADLFHTILGLVDPGGVDQMKRDIAQMDFPFN